MLFRYPIIIFYTVILRHGRDDISLAKVVALVDCDVTSVFEWWMDKRSFTVNQEEYVLNLVSFVVNVLIGVKSIGFEKWTNPRYEWSVVILFEKQKFWVTVLVDVGWRLNSELVRKLFDKFCEILQFFFCFVSYGFFNFDIEL